MRNILKKFLYLNIIIWLGNYYYAQNNINQSIPQILPTSPDVKALARYGTIPIGLATGVPDISIPFYSIKSGNLDFPISLSYHASGIKVRDIASVAGLGWSLNYGGVIAKINMGKPDEMNLPYHNLRSALDLNTAAATCYPPNCSRGQLAIDFHSLRDGYFETESDRYVYNFAGHNGAFRYDVNGNMHKVPYSPIAISKNILIIQVIVISIMKLLMRVETSLNLKKRNIQQFLE
uniref:Type IX secretion system membrane protein PorP/SprF n=1 Tax=Chryseobacterium endophyticum TaxID=1854762 RepID=A0AAU6WSJ1_9FLAO